jgi:hypothetical protein
MLVDAAGTLTPLDAALARDTYLDAIDAALINGGDEAVPVAEAALAAPASAVPPRPSDLLLDALVTTFTAGFAAGAPAMRVAVEAFRDEADTALVLGGRSERWLWLAERTAVGVFDDELALALPSRHVQLARQTGALEMLPAALNMLSTVLILTGELARAGELAVESTAIAEATGAVPLRHGLIMLAAWHGVATATVRSASATSSSRTPPTPTAPGRWPWPSTRWRCCTTGSATTPTRRRQHGARVGPMSWRS